MASVNPKLRWSCAFVFVGATVILIAYTITSYLTLDLSKGFDVLNFNDLIKDAIDAKKDLSERLFELGLLLLAALWGLLIAKKEESGIVLSRNPELIAFACASLLLLMSMVSHALYLQVLIDAFADSGFAYTEDDKTIINVFDHRFEYFSRMQIVNLIAGATMAITTLLSAHKLNEKEE